MDGWPCLAQENPLTTLSSQDTISPLPKSWPLSEIYLTCYIQPELHRHQAAVWVGCKVSPHHKPSIPRYAVPMLLGLIYFNEQRRGKERHNRTTTWGLLKAYFTLGSKQTNKWIFSSVTGHSNSVSATYILWGSKKLTHSGCYSCPRYGN